MSGSANVVTFSYADWSALFPELVSSVTGTQAQIYFNVACRLIDNTPYSVIPVLDANQQPCRETILNFATAHIAALFGTINGAAPSGLVGAISQATEGSVSVSTNLPDLPMAAAELSQTRYGLMVWTMTAPYRTATYVSGPRLRYNGIRRGW